MVMYLKGNVGGVTEINDELRDLKTRDPFFPRNADAARALEVVPVHDDVHEQVQRDGHPRDGGVSDELRVAEQCCGGVVITMKES
jgi:hypothetical protein